MEIIIVFKRLFEYNLGQASRMVQKLEILIASSSPTQVIALGLLTVGLIGVMDHITGFEMAFSIFYLIPVVFVTWFSRQWTGYLICGISAAVWLITDLTSGHAYSFWLIPVWNTVVRLVFFLVAAYLLGQLKQHLKQEELLARTDDLTQVLNTRAFNELTTRMLQLAARHHHPVVLGYIDLDNFKAVNDEFGHSEGDRVLKMAASILTKCVRTTDIVGRLGGDEFAVFMPESDFADAQAAFSRIQLELVQNTAFQGWQIGFSIGIAYFPMAPLTIDEALKIADRLMYRVKASGKNNVLFEEQVSVDQITQQ